jgi:potassium efflux system protein
MVKVLFEIMVFAPIIRIIKPVVDPRFLPELYVLWVLYAVDAFRQALSGGQFSGQFIVIIETLAGATVLMWSLVSGQLRHSSIQAAKLFRKSALAAVVTLVFIALSVGLVAGILGYLSLARILASEIVAGGAMAAGLYAFVRIFIGIIAFRLRVWPLRSLNMVVNHRNLIERRALRLTILAACLVFLNRLLDYTGFLGPTLSWLKTILALKFERGSVSISIEDILAFILTVWASYLLSALLRFILQEDVYPRIGVQKGMAYATSSLINYIILAIGFIVGLGVIGVSLTKMTVLAGAFGVGIGFGLQSIVNNFVSGLILLFERPLHVGDIIEMDGLNGEVRRIGMRASTVRTWHGSDIVVPNADLVTKQVTNWTLGDKLRRIDLPVGVNYGADPEEVVQIFKKVAKANPDVLHSPEPSALFTGYGDSSINFELRAWTDKFNDWQRIRSDLATAVYRAGHEAGLSFPFPQRDVHIIRDSDAGTTNNPVSVKK